MFTGIISKIGVVERSWKKAGSLFLVIKKPKNWQIKPSDSICTDGVCLTVKEVDKKHYTTELMPETLKKTTFGKAVADYVNLERPLALKDRLHGHIALGHVDTIGKITAVKKQGYSKIYTFSFPKKYQYLVVKKGSIAVDGVSLTVTDCKNATFKVSLVDYTLLNTALSKKKQGDIVNIEFDILAKYSYSFHEKFRTSS